MKQRTKWLTTLSCILVASVLLFCLSLVNLHSTYATSGTADYTVYNDGIVLNSDPTHGVKVAYKQISAQHGYTANTSGTIYEGLSFKFNKSIKTTEYDGLLINIANDSGSTINFFNWFSQDGTNEIYRQTNASSAALTYLKSDGTANATSTTGFYWGSGKLNIVTGVSGTWNLPFTEIKAQASSKTINQMVLSLPVGITKSYGAGLWVGDIAAYKADETSETGYIVDLLFDADSLTITRDADNTNSDFNLVDLSKGKLVNNIRTGNTSNGVWVTDEQDRSWAKNRVIMSYYLNVAEDLEKSVSINYASDSSADKTHHKTVGNLVYNALYANVSFKLDQSYNIYSNYVGALVKISNSSDRAVKFNHYYLSGSNIVRYSSAVTRNYKPFIDENGVNIASNNKGVSFGGSFYTITANTAGTWNIKFADELKAGWSSSGANAVNEIIFALRIDEDTYSNVGIEIESISFYDKCGVITEVFNAEDLSATNDIENSTAGINIADETKGTSVYVDMNKAVWTNRGDYYNNAQIVDETEKEACYEWALGKIDLGYTGLELPVPEEPVAVGTKTVYMDGAGKLYKENAEGLTEVVLNIANRYGASIRYDLQTPGIRFGAEVGYDGIEALGEAGLANVKFGMLIASTELAGDSLDFNETNHFENVVIDRENSWFLNKDATMFCYNVAVHNIPEEHYADTIIAQSYLEITYADGQTEIVYGEIPEMQNGDTLASNVRSVAGVAQTILDSGVSLTTDQISILNKFVGA